MNASRLTQKYIREHPSVADCLDRGLINYSALAREICREQGVDSFDAILVACRRYYERSKNRRSQEQSIQTLLSKAKVRVRTKILVATLDKYNMLERALKLQELVRKERGDFNLIEGEEALTIVTNTEYAASVEKLFEGNVIKIRQDLVQVTMIFDERIENTPGVVSYIFRSLAENRVNIREEMSCWTDVMIVIDEGDLPKVMDIIGS
jgi:aspartokinase